ncbi:rhodanese-like domain-containing protein [Candidatus Dependentiae bacterium]|nr:rhodanese-like domain-containing protein [Candidatus Dependentiae bacterium]
MIKKMFSALVFGSLLVVLPACFGDSNKHDNCTSCPSHHHDDGTELREAMPGLIVVNVLDKEHFENCRIPGSMSVPFQQIDSFVTQLNEAYADKSAVEIVVYCSNYMCSASGEAAKILKKNGFEHVMAYEAGMAEWYQQGLPTEGPCKLDGFTYLKKVMGPVETEHQFAVITTQELAQKLGFGGEVQGQQGEAVEFAREAESIK